MTIQQRQLVLLIIALISLIMAPLAVLTFANDDSTPGPGDGSNELCMGTAECLEGEVTSIVDGDTLYIEGVKIRLSLVDTPESGEAGFSEAKDFVEGLCPEGSQAVADQDDWQLEDQYGRMLAVVYCGGKNLNRELLESGHAVILTYYCDLSEFGWEPWAVEYGC
jgi:micrococcal nuclease